jgi:hypothetical protein
MCAPRELRYIIDLLSGRNATCSRVKHVERKSLLNTSLCRLLRFGDDGYHFSLALQKIEKEYDLIKKLTQRLLGLQVHMLAANLIKFKSLRTVDWKQKADFKVITRKS